MAVGIVVCTLTATTACGELQSTGSEAGGATTTEVTSAPFEGRPSITDFCGDKPIQVALADGFGGNSLRKIMRRQFELEAAKCANITKTFYTDANADPQKYASDINGLVAQGVNAIITLNDFGPAALPALRKATKAGVVVVPYKSNPGGTPGSDYEVFVSEDSDAVGKEWAEWGADILHGNGQVAMLGGTPGNALSTAFLDGYKKAAPDGLRLVQDDPITTNWTIAGMQQAVTGLLTKHADTGLLLADYGATIPAIARAYAAAGKPLVPIAVTASSNEVGCAWEGLKAQNPDFELLSIDGTGNVPKIALRKAVAAAQGLENPESPLVKLSVFIDTKNGKMPTCNPALPPDADLSADLTPEQMKEVFAR
ncbi:substrate-binding domain-containing protein [Arthrobacter sp. NPDC093128]|uniref:substrate-binding domain-containing protein n=1 Tax=Arthrobacter sp. NPDC093128 TaxID=3154979 RepID=UPI00343D33FC